MGAVRIVATDKTVSREQVIELSPTRRPGDVILPGSFLHEYWGDISVAPAPAGGTDLRWRGSSTLRLISLGWLLERSLRRSTGPFPTHASQARLVRQPHQV